MMITECLLIDLDETLAVYDKTSCVKSVALRSLNLAWIAAAYTNNYKDHPTLKHIYNKGLHNNEIHDDVSISESKIYGKARNSLSLKTIKKNPELRASLIEARDAGLHLYVVTKTPKDKAIKILGHLGIADLFDNRVFNVIDKQYYQTYEFFINRNIPNINANLIALLDDTKENVYAAHDAGLMHSRHINNDDISISDVIREYVLEKRAYDLNSSFDMV